MASWESQQGHLLPRPVVLEGDLHADDLRLECGRRPLGGRALR